MQTTNKKSKTRHASAEGQSVLPAPLYGARFLTAQDVMPLLGYTDVPGFWQAVRNFGIPFVRINRRKCLFEESALRAWIDSRTVGSVPRNAA